MFDSFEPGRLGKNAPPRYPAGRDAFWRRRACRNRRRNQRIGR